MNSASFLQSSVSHDLQKLFWYDDLLLKKHFSLLMLQSIVLLHIYVETWHFLQDSFMNRIVIIILISILSLSVSFILKSISTAEFGQFTSSNSDLKWGGGVELCDKQCDKQFSINLFYSVVEMRFHNWICPFWMNKLNVNKYFFLNKSIHVLKYCLYSRLDNSHSSEYSWKLICSESKLFQTCSER